MKSFKEVSEYLDSLINYEVEFPLGGSRDRPKLDPVYRAARELKVPLELSRCIHIAGTVGKGSVAAMCQAMLSVHQRVLSFTSPHLVSPKERVQLDGRDLSDDIWCEGMTFMRERLALAGLQLTYFETVFVFFLWCSQKLGDSAHVVETGLGGSFDATNVLENTTAVMTKIDFDHTHILGKTLAEIARDKSGIIKDNLNCFSVVQSADVLRELENTCLQKNATLNIEKRDFETNRTFGVPLTGDFQRSNLSVSLAAVKALDTKLTDTEIQAALNGLSLRARQQEFPNHPNLILDVCHNPISFAELAACLKSIRRFSRRIALVAMMKDKDARESLRHLAGVVDEVWITDAPTPRSYSPETLRSIAEDVGLSAKCVNRNEAYHDLLSLPDTTLGVVCGSFYLVGDFMKSYPDA